MFGYIAEGSVAIRPEYNEVEFEIESIAGVMNRETSPPVFLLDSADPSAEDDAWAWGQNVNVFRGMVYLLKFHSTIMDIADVALYNDTTLTKAVDYPQDTLWNMLIQFAKGKRLMRGGVTRTGRIVVGRDPNLVPVAQRTAFITVMQLAQGDWQEQITAPQMPYPRTSFLCLSGLTYDGIPANEPNPVFGMSPGRPPKDHGSERELQFLKLVDQTEANTLAGLLVGTDNMPYGEIVIPMRGNWTRAFDPAYQEYVQTPASGFVTKRETILASELLIVRKVSVSFDWESGTMNPTLTCDYYSYPEVSTNGDCWTADAPPNPIAPPGGNSIYAPAPPRSTGAGIIPMDVWTLFSNQDIYRLTSLASGAGVAVSKPAWDAGLGASLQARGLAAGAGQNVMLAADASFYVHLAHSSDHAASWTATDMSVEGTGDQTQSDRTNRNRAWAINGVTLTNTDKQLFADTIGISVGDRTQSDAINNHTDYRADWGAVYVWHTTNGGGSWTPLLLGYVGRLVPMRMNLINQGESGFPMMVSAHMRITAPALVAHPPDADVYSEAYNSSNGTVLGFLCTAISTTPWDCNWEPKYIGCYDGFLATDYPLPYSRTADEVTLIRYDNAAVLNVHSGYRLCSAFTGIAYTAVKYWEPTRGPFIVAPKHNNLECYAVLPIHYYDTSAQLTTGSPGLELYPLSPIQVWNAGDVLTHTRIGANFLYLLDGVGGKEEYTLPVADYSASPTDIVVYAAANLVTPTTLYMIAGNNLFISFDWTAIGGGPPPFTDSTLPIGGNVACGIMVTTQGTILIGVRSSPRTILRSTNGGGSWTALTPAALSGHFFEIFLCTEYGGSVGGSVGKLAFPVDPEGRYLYSLDDGLTWALSGVVTSLQYASANSAR